MKSQFKFTSLLLALIIALGSFSACAESGNSNDSTEDSGTQTESSTVTDNENAADLSLFPENAFPIFDGKTYAVKVVTSDTASSA